jgi:SAM-dependent methyltransferase
MGERKHLDEDAWSGHHVRYLMASGFVAPGDTVLDAACGIGYGSEMFRHRGISYVGVDQSFDTIAFEQESWRKFVHADLTSWSPDFDFDVFVSFETIEHVPDYSNLINIARNAKKWMLMSVPIVPTKHMNPWHLHDFAPGELPNYVVNDEWELFDAFQQPSEFSEIYVFSRR